MRCIPICLMVVLVQSFGAVVAGVEVEYQPEDAIEKFRVGDRSGLVVPYYKTNAGQAALTFIKEATTFKEDIDRLRVIGFAIRLREYGFDPSEKEEIVSCLIAILKTEASSLVARELASALRGWLSPAELEPYARDLLAAALKHKDVEVAMLYGVLPSLRPEELFEFLKPFETLQDGRTFSKMQLDAIRARYGDKDAEERLISFARSMSTVSGFQISTTVDVLSYVPNDTMKRFLAGGLRSEVMVSRVGGGAIPHRDVYADALVRMMRFDESFPVKRRQGVSYVDEELDQLEAWCTEHLNVRYPEEKRKPLYAIPHIIMDATSG